MAAESRDPEIDVDSLFSEIGASERPAPAGKVHLAVTMRPVPERLATVPAAPASPATISATMSRASSLADPAASRVASVEPAEVSPALFEPVGIVKGARGVTGYVVRGPDGGVAVHGAVDGRLADRLAYLARLATLVGDELGLEGLREVNAIGAERRAAVVLARDGSSLAVLATVDAPLDDLATRKR